MSAGYGCPSLVVSPCVEVYHHTSPREQSRDGETQEGDETKGSPHDGRRDDESHKAEEYLSCRTPHTRGKVRRRG